MDDALHHFHTLKELCFVGRAGTKAKAKPNALRTELMKKRKGDKGTNAETLTPSKKQLKINTSQDYISHEIDILNVLDADFKCPKIHLIYHCTQEISRYGYLQ
jgi:hypothetical protein